MSAQAATPASAPAPSAPAPPSSGQPPQSIAQVQHHIRSYQAVIDAMQKIKTPTEEQLAALPHLPQMHDQEVMAGLGNWGTLLAIFGSLATREPMTAALNAAANGMRAYHQGSMDAAAQQKKDFELNLRRAIETNRETQNKYIAKMQAANFDISKARGTLTAIAAEHHDTLMQANLSENKSFHVASLAMKRLEIGAQLELLHTRMRAQQAQTALAQRAEDTKEATLRLNTSKVLLSNGIQVPFGYPGYAAPGAPKGAAGNEADLFAPANIEAAATTALFNKFQFPMGLSGKGAALKYHTLVAAAGNKRIMAYGGPAAFLARQASYKAHTAALDQNTRLLTSLQSYDAALGPLVHHLIALVRQLGGSSLPLVQSMNIMAQHQGGVPLVNEIKATIYNVNAEMGRILTGGAAGGGSVTVSAQQEQAAIIDVSMPPQVIIDTVKTNLRNASYRIAGVKANSTRLAQEIAADVALPSETAAPAAGTVAPTGGSSDTSGIAPGTTGNGGILHYNAQGDLVH